MRSQYQRPRTSLVASIIPSVPPASWYENPNLTAPTAITVTDDGKIFGHLAPWGTCHTGFRDSCVTAPKSTTDYAYFTIGSTAVECDDCDDKKVSEVRTGVITLGTLHAGQKLNGKAALSHYENTGAAVADVAAGEDVHGIWIAGALRPTVTEKEMRELRGAALSGDWRRINGNLELVAALAVNTPGFPVIRASAFVAEDGEQMSLVAAGALVAEVEVEAGLAAESEAEVEVEAEETALEKAKSIFANSGYYSKRKKKQMAKEDLIGKIELAFSPDQERDENGKWTSGGGDNERISEGWPQAQNKDGVNMKGEDLRGTRMAGWSLQEASLDKADLSGAFLTEANFQGAYLTNANLSGAEMIRSDLRGADLHGANASSANMQEADLVKAVAWQVDFQAANLQGANFAGAKAMDSDFRNASLINTTFKDASLTNANFEGANLTKTNLSGADMTGAKMNGAFLPEWRSDYNVDLSKATGTITTINLRTNTVTETMEASQYGVNPFREGWLPKEIASDSSPTYPNRQMSLIGKIELAFSPDQERDENGKWTSGGGGSDSEPKNGKVDISEIKRGADLSGRDLSGMNLKGRDMSDTNLFGANLSEANLTGASLEGAYLKNANLSSAGLLDADLTDANLTGANLNDASLYRANLSGASLKEVNLEGANLHTTDFRGANLRNANLANSSCNDTNFDNANLKNADFRNATLIGTQFNGAEMTGVNFKGATFSAVAISEEQTLTAKNVPPALLQEFDQDRQD